MAAAAHGEVGGAFVVVADTTCGPLLGAGVAGGLVAGAFVGAGVGAGVAAVVVSDEPVVVVASPDAVVVESPTSDDEVVVSPLSTERDEVLLQVAMVSRVTARISARKRGDDMPAV